MNHLNQVGIDIIRISGFTNCQKFAEPVVHHLINDQQYEKIITKSNTTIKNNSVMINGGFYVFKWGNNRGKAFSYIELHAADENGNNLYNMGLADIHDKLHLAIDDLHTRYNITFPYLDLDKLRVTYAEINRTFVTQHPFSDYSALLMLIGYEARKQYHQESYAVYASDTDNLRSRTECIYLLRGKDNFDLKVYDKTLELKAKKVLDPDHPTNYMRFELTLKKECELKNTKKEAFLSKMTDQQIYNCFRIKIKKIIQATDIYFKDNLLNGSKECLPLDQLFMHHLLQFGINNPLAYESFLRDIVFLEGRIHKPYIKGIEDIINLINNNKYIREKEICIKLLVQACNLQPEYRSFLDRGKKYEELKYHLLEPQQKRN